MLLIGKRTKITGSWTHYFTSAFQITLSTVYRKFKLVARLIIVAKRSDHISQILVDLHWLPVSSRIDYKVLVHTFRAISDTAPAYISDMINIHQPSRPLRKLEKGSENTPFYLSSFSPISFIFSSKCITYHCQLLYMFHFLSMFLITIL